jgi:hypothetical protein
MHRLSVLSNVQKVALERRGDPRMTSSGVLEPLKSQTPSTKSEGFRCRVSGVSKNRQEI